MLGSVLTERVLVLMVESVHLRKGTLYLSPTMKADDSYRESLLLHIYLHLAMSGKKSRAIMINTKPFTYLETLPTY